MKIGIFWIRTTMGAFLTTTVDNSELLLFTKQKVNILRVDNGDYEADRL